MKVKELFEKAEGGTLTYEQFEALAKEANAKFADLNEGNYVSKHKYEDELEAKLKEIETLNGTIGTRDTDLADLRRQLKEAGDGVIRLDELSMALEDLQGRYDEDTKAYQQQLKNQAYEFAVKEFANDKEFTSSAAKRDFIKSMIDAELKVDKNGKVLGMDDFMKEYQKENNDAFVVKQKEAPVQESSTKAQPQFVSSTPGAVASKPVSLTEMMISANKESGV